MSRTIKRGTPPRRPAPRKKQPVRKVSRMDRLVAALPVSETTLRRAATWTITGGVVAIALVVAGVMGVPGMVGTALGEGAGRAGFRVTGVEIVGQHHMDSNTIRAVALDQPSLAMPLVDLDGIRDRLLAYGWIEDAAVSRRLPDTLLITITERTPAAIWQDNGQLTLIDASGALLDPVDRNAMPDLPLVIGPGGRSAGGGVSETARGRAGDAPADHRGDLGRQSPLGPDLRQRRNAQAARSRRGGCAGHLCGKGRRSSAARARLAEFRHARSDEARRAQTGGERRACLADG